MNKTDVITAAINYKNDIIDLEQFKTIVEQCFSSQHSGNAHVGSSGDGFPDEDEEDWQEPEQQCSACCMVGGHMRGCPEDESPYAQLLRDGYD